MEPQSVLGQAEAWSCIWISVLAGTGPRAWPSPAAVPGALAGTEVVQLGLEPVPYWWMLNLLRHGAGPIWFAL